MAIMNTRSVTAAIIRIGDMSKLFNRKQNYLIALSLSIARFAFYIKIDCRQTRTAHLRTVFVPTVGNSRPRHRSRRRRSPRTASARARKRRRDGRAAKKSRSRGRTGGAVRARERSRADAFRACVGKRRLRRRVLRSPVDGSQRCTRHKRPAFYNKILCRDIIRERGIPYKSRCRTVVARMGGKKK